LQPECEAVSPQIESLCDCEQVRSRQQGPRHSRRFDGPDRVTRTRGRAGPRRVPGRHRPRSWNGGARLGRGAGGSFPASQRLPACRPRRPWPDGRGLPPEPGRGATGEGQSRASRALDPQSGERFRGRSRIQAQHDGHPAERHSTIRRIQTQYFADPFGGRWHVLELDRRW